MAFGFIEFRYAFLIPFFAFTGDVIDRNLAIPI